MRYDRMKEIQAQIDDELEGAYKYIKCALLLKDSDRTWADTYYQMAQQEYNHMTNLHSLAVNEIRKLGEDGDRTYNTMKEIYDYLHEKMMLRASEIQTMINMYKA